MIAAYIPLVIQCGETMTLAVQVLDANGAAFNLTGYTVKMKVRDNTSGSTTLRLTTAGDTTTPSGGTLVGSLVTAAEGRLQVTATATITAALQTAGLRTGWYTLNVVSGATIVRVMEGPVDYSYEASY